MSLSKKQSNPPAPGLKPPPPPPPFSLRGEISITNALSIDGWTSEQELTYLARQASNIVNGKVVEVGTYLGRSARAIADNLGSRSQLICVDPYDRYSDPKIRINDGDKSLNGDLLFAAARLNVICKAGRKPLPIFMREPSTKAALKFRDHELDMVFIDAEHTYLSVRNDIYAWWRTIKPGGTLCGHDYGGPHEGVKQAVEEAFTFGQIKFPAGSIWAVTKGIGGR